MICSHPIASRAANPRDRIRHPPISVPVRPSPALQCTATRPAASSMMSRKRRTASADGAVQSSKGRSKFSMPRATNPPRSFSLSLSRTTVVTPSSLNSSA